MIALASLINKAGCFLFSQFNKILLIELKTLNLIENNITTKLFFLDDNEFIGQYL